MMDRWEIREKLLAPYWKARHVVANVGKVLHWIPVIWRTPDYDYHGIYEVLRYQLYRMAVHIKEHDFICEAEQVHDEIMVAASELQDLMDKRYFRDAVDEHTKKWGKMDWVWVDVDRIAGFQEWTGTVYSKANTEEENDQAEQEFRELCERTDKLYEEHRKAVFQYISDKMLGWWD